VRKTVTVLFCHLVGSTALGDQADPEVLQETMSRYHGELRTILERHGGRVEKFVGDAAMAVFGIPEVHEDDALRAARAGTEIQEAVSALGLEVRIGLNTGEVVAGTGETLVTGDAVNVAARLEQAAQAGEILLGESTERLVRDAVRTEAIEPLPLKGKAEPVVPTGAQLSQAGLARVARQQGNGSAPIVRMLIQLGADYALDVVAEGVETAAQAAALAGSLNWSSSMNHNTGDTRSASSNSPCTVPSSP